ncbi:ead/Ea22-like family protein [Klebsiella pneumoniae]|uniref:ead/Ea22-like family protein n=2 Tax=Klebsiella pneumoniae TaxID=573 RepID=UPI0025A2DEC3|nr:ead/Ea22-like family protein [Klebsiella pneumoniae]MDM7040866.1 ead/Ea22-like family protein [Klebsiella pneumoniae]MDM7103500.1 ead/Ea22-like family protein [Klebsiella pneumoniae]MDM7107628.1 ead/Ea22-like family protein [Klebsiella pneumoniae]MDM7117532.1 ead/Ea22-like family protein [Klebsiella pneumoniae]MDM7125524.1 ead/Ea22-like family protein [Klebsiella pneumoniae]
MSNIDKQALRERYSAKPTPKCHICGTEMTVQRMSASRITYGCTGATYDDTGCHYAAGRSIADDHYEQSRVTIVDVSDPDVLALLDELEAAEKRNAEMSESNRLLCADSMIKQDRIAELEARKVKIKLPESFYPDGDIDCPLVINEYQIIEAIVAADCKPIAVCPRCKCELDLSHKPDGAHFCHPDAAGKGE